MPFLGKTTGKLFINAIVMPHFDYCSEAWLSPTNVSLKSLERLCNKATKLASNQDRVTLHDRLDKDLAIFTHKCFNDLTPSHLQEKFELTSSVHQKTQDHVDDKRYDIC